ncbi:hypothetical protein F4804DRAFT_302966 [Jackrogersella minutella]|nr:hypothetical protein F4804DRAFT_302966 [Jackrogersella minutella]
MAPVPFQHPVRYAPLAAAGARLVSTVYFIYAIAASLYTSYKSLGPAQDTRSRLAQRKRLVPIFLGLAVTALWFATYTSLASAILSYRTWAYEHGLDKPESFISDDVIFPEENSNQPNIYIAQWLSDIPLYYDNLEIIAEKARRFWWGQQIDLATVAFSMLLSIEGRRRNIPLTSAFLILAHHVNLSFAQNLFSLALILTPSPLPSDESLELPVAPFRSSRLVQIRNKFIIPKPKNWYLHPFVLLSGLALNYGSIFLLPYAAETPSFANVAFLSRASTFLPLILPEIVPASWGTVFSHPHDAYSSLTTIFRAISFASFALHVKSSVIGLITSTPNSHYHRHSVFVPWDMEERTNWERSTTAFSKVMGSIYDHPAVKAVGWDVLFCALSLGLWAATRTMDVQGIIESTTPFYNFHRRTEQVVEDKRPSTPIKPDPDDIASEHSMTLRRRRSTKSRVGSVASSSGPSEEGTRTPGRKRGRPRKTKQPEDEKSYEPDPSETRELVEGDTLPANELDWESAALAWGIAAFSGLGSASAGVFGAECTSR